MTRDWGREELEFAAGLSETRCPPPALLLGARNGELPAELAAGVTKHWNACRTCQMLVQDLSALHAELRTSAVQARVLDRIRRADRKSRWRWPLAIAAAPALAALLLLVHPWRPAATSGRQAPPVAQPAMAQKHPEIPKPPVFLPATVLTFRGEPDAAKERLLADFGAAIAPYREDRYPDAVQQLTAFTHKYPAMPEGFFYLGVSLLYEGQRDNARSNLERARQLSQPPLRDQIEPYLQLARP